MKYAVCRMLTNRCGNHENNLPRNSESNQELEKTNKTKGNDYQSILDSL